MTVLLCLFLFHVKTGATEGHDELGRQIGETDPISKCFSIQCGPIDKDLTLTIELKPGCKVRGVIPIKDLMDSAYLTLDENCRTSGLCGNSICDSDCLDENLYHINLYDDMIKTTVSVDNQRIQSLDYSTMMKFGTEQAIFLPPYVNLTCTYTFTSDYDQFATSLRQIFNCDNAQRPCLYHQPRPDTSELIILGVLDHPAHACNNASSDGLELDLSDISCTLNTPEYLQSVPYYQSTQCKRRKCKCKPGFTNKDWRCAGNVEGKSLTVRLSEPFAATISSSVASVVNWKSQFEVNIKSELQEIKHQLVVNVINLDFSALVIHDSICSSCDTARRRQATESTDDVLLYADIMYSYQCEQQHCTAVTTEIKDTLGGDFETTTFLAQMNIAMNKVKRAMNATIVVPKSVKFLVDDIDKLNLSNEISSLKINSVNDQEAKNELIEEQAAKVNDNILQMLDQGTEQTENNVEMNVAEVEQAEEQFSNVALLDSLFASSAGASDEDGDDFFGDVGDKDDKEEKKEEAKETDEEEEEQVLTNFASLTAAELEASFGSFKPIRSLNPYMAKLDPCQVITINQTVSDRITTMSYIKHNRVFRIADFNTADCTGALEKTCLELSLIVPPSMKDTLQMKISRDDVYVNIQLNRDRWSMYMTGDYSDTTWGVKPTSQFLVRLVKRRMIRDETIETLEGVINIIVPKTSTCDLSIKSSDDSEIINFYRELFAMPPINPWGNSVLGTGTFDQCVTCDTCSLDGKPPLFECDIKAPFAEAIQRVLGIIAAVQTTSVNFVRRVPCVTEYSMIKEMTKTNLKMSMLEQDEDAIDAYIDSKMIVGDAETPDCFIIEYVIQIKVNEKLVNGESLGTSLDNASEMLQEELNILMRQAPRATIQVNDTSETAATPRQADVKSETQLVNEAELEEKIVDALAARRSVILKRQPTKVPGRAAVMYAGAFIVCFILAYNIVRYYNFICLCHQICQYAAITDGTLTKLKVFIDLIQVGLISISFALEMVNVLEYIQGTRLSLIRFDATVAFLLILMCLTRLTLLYVRWTFFIHQWTDRVDHFKNEITLNTESDSTLRGLSIILTILMHDCIYKFLKIFYFSRFKPAGLQMTTAQLLAPLFDVLLVVVSFMSIVKELYNLTMKREDMTGKMKFFLFSPLYNSSMAFLMKQRERQVFRYRRRLYGRGVSRVIDQQFWTLLLLLIVIPMFYIAFKTLACLIELMIAIATLVNQQEALANKQLADVASSMGAKISGTQSDIEAATNDLTIQSTISESFNEAADAAQAQIDMIKCYLPVDLINSFKARTCVSQNIDPNFNIHYLARPFMGTSDEGLPCLNNIELSLIITLALTMCLSFGAMFSLRKKMVDVKKSMIDLLERNKDDTATQMQVERLAYESLVHTWEADDDYYTYKEQRQYNTASATKTGLLSALISGLIVGTGDVDDE